MLSMFEVANKLLILSRDRKLSWDQTIKDSQFRVDFPDASLAISHQASTDSYRLDLIGDTGTVLKSLTWGPGCEITTTKAGPTEFNYASLREIYELAEAYIQDNTIERVLKYMERV